MSFGGLEYVILEFMYLPIFIPILAIIVGIISLISNIIHRNLKKCIISSIIILIPIIVLPIANFILDDWFLDIKEVIYIRPILTIIYFLPHLLITLFIDYKNNQNKEK